MKPIQKKRTSLVKRNRSRTTLQTQTLDPLTAQTAATALQRLAANPKLADLVTLQRTVGNRALNQLLTPNKIQAKPNVATLTPLAQQAQPFTPGQDVFLREGAYQPGKQAGQTLIAHELTPRVQQPGLAARLAIQRKKHELSNDKLNIVGEKHNEEDDTRRADEKKLATEKAGGGYWTEHEFRGKDPRGTLAKLFGKGAPPGPIDGPDLVFEGEVAAGVKIIDTLKKTYGLIQAAEALRAEAEKKTDAKQVERFEDEIYDLTEDRIKPHIFRIGYAIKTAQANAEKNKLKPSKEVASLLETIQLVLGNMSTKGLPNKDFENSVGDLEFLAGDLKKAGIRTWAENHLVRSQNMLAGGEKAAAMKGIWKIGDGHIEQILNGEVKGEEKKQANYITRADFDETYPALLAGFKTRHRE